MPLCHIKHLSGVRFRKRDYKLKEKYGKISIDYKLINIIIIYLIYYNNL